MVNADKVKVYFAFFVCLLMPFGQTAWAEGVESVRRAAVLEAQLTAEQNKLIFFEKKMAEIAETRKKAEIVYFEKNLALKKLEHQNPKVKSIYHSQTPVLTNSGAFYDAALEEKKAAENNLLSLRAREHQMAGEILNQKRLILERMQRFKNHEEAAQEQWENNPF